MNKFVIFLLLIVFSGVVLANIDKDQNSKIQSMEDEFIALKEEISKLKKDSRKGSRALRELSQLKEEIRKLKSGSIPKQ